MLCKSTRLISGTPSAVEISWWDGGRCFYLLDVKEVIRVVFLLLARPFLLLMVDDLLEDMLYPIPSIAIVECQELV